MQSVSQILGVSYIAILGLLAISVSKITFAAYRATLSGKRLNYVYDKSRLARCGRVILIDTGICIAYALLITNLADDEAFIVNVAASAVFGLLALPFTVLACYLSICFIPRNSKNK